jgi:hypothetical protein
MLAYVFWHWPDAQTDHEHYQNALISFHRTLAAHRPAGLHFSRCLLLDQAPWLERDSATYEDWSLVENSAALDPLNEGAVTGACQEPHRQVARWTVGSGAGLYQLRAGDASLATISQEYRFNKPEGMSYAALYESLQPLITQHGAGLWTRQMNLGPGPEFCLLAPAAFALPASFEQLEIAVRLLWSGSEREG